MKILGIDNGITKANPTGLAIVERYGDNLFVSKIGQLTMDVKLHWQDRILSGINVLVDCQLDFQGLSLEQPFMGKIKGASTFEKFSFMNGVIMSSFYTQVDRIITARVNSSRKKVLGHGGYKDDQLIAWAITTKLVDSHYCTAHIANAIVYAMYAHCLIDGKDISYFNIKPKHGKYPYYLDLIA